MADRELISPVEFKHYPETRWPDVGLFLNKESFKQAVDEFLSTLPADATIEVMPGLAVAGWYRMAVEVSVIPDEPAEE